MHVLSLPPAFVLSQDQTLKLKEFDLDYMSLRKLTEHLSLQVSPERCTHQSIEQVDVYSIRSTWTGARTPPPTLLFPSQQCQRAKSRPERQEQNSDHPGSPSRPSKVRSSPAQAPKNRAADGPDLGPRPAAVNRVQDSFLKLSRSRSSPRASRGKVIPFAKTAMFLR